MKKGKIAPLLCALLCAFRYPALKEFTGMISEFLEAGGKYSDAQAIHNAALDYQVDARERLTVTGALMIAGEMED